MKNFFLLPIMYSVVISILFARCGKATEQRSDMDATAKRTADSLRTSIDSALVDPIKEFQSFAN